MLIIATVTTLTIKHGLQHFSILNDNKSVDCVNRQTYSQNQFTCQLITTMSPTVQTSFKDAHILNTDTSLQRIIATEVHLTTIVAITQALPLRPLINKSQPTCPQQAYCKPHVQHYLVRKKNEHKFVSQSIRDLPVCYFTCIHNLSSLLHYFSLDAPVPHNSSFTPCQ